MTQCSINTANSAMIITYYKLHNRKGENHSLLKQFTRCVLISSCRTWIVPGFKPKGNGDRKTNSKNSTVIWTLLLLWREQLEFWLKILCCKEVQYSPQWLSIKNRIINLDFFIATVNCCDNYPMLSIVTENFILIDLVRCKDWFLLK